MLRKVCGFVIDANVEIPGFECGNEEPQWTFNVVNALIFQANWHEFRSFTSFGGKKWLSYGLFGTKYLVRFSDTADYVISVGENRIECSPQKPSCVDDAILLFVNSVFPLALSLKSERSFHASVVAKNDKAIAFLAESGRGKSTLAAHLSQEGFHAISDDSLLIQENAGDYHAIPSYPAFRLWSDSYSTLNLKHTPSTDSNHGPKHVIFPEVFSQNPVTLKQIYIIAPESDQLSISRLGPSAAITELTKHLFRLAVTTPTSLRAEFSFLCDLIVKVPVYSLEYPRDFKQIPNIQKAIIENLGEIETSPQKSAAKSW